MPPRCGDRGQRVWLQALPSAVRGTLEPPPPSRPQCYYMGIGDKELGTAGGVKREVSGSLSRWINAKRLCTRMKKQDAQMCELRYEKKVDVKNTDLSKLRVKELRKICDDEGIPTKGAPGGVFCGTGAVASPSPERTPPARAGFNEKGEFIKAIKDKFGIKDEM